MQAPPPATSAPPIGDAGEELTSFRVEGGQSEPISGLLTSETGPTESHQLDFTGADASEVETKDALMSVQSAEGEFQDAQETFAGGSSQISSGFSTPRMIEEEQTPRSKSGKKKGIMGLFGKFFSSKGRDEVSPRQPNTSPDATVGGTSAKPAESSPESKPVDLPAASTQPTASTAPIPAALQMPSAPAAAPSDKPTAAPETTSPAAPPSAVAPQDATATTASASESGTRGLPVPAALSETAADMGIKIPDASASGTVGTTSEQAPVVLPSDFNAAADAAGLELGFEPEPAAAAPAASLPTGVTDLASKVGVDLPGAGTKGAPVPSSGVADLASKVGVDLPGSGTEAPVSLPAGVADVASKVGVDLPGTGGGAPLSLASGATDAASKVGLDLPGVEVPGTGVEVPVTVAASVADAASKVGVDLPITEAATAAALPSGVTVAASKIGIDLPGTDTSAPVSLPGGVADAASKGGIDLPSSGGEALSLPIGVTDMASKVGVDLPGTESAAAPSLPTGVSDIASKVGLDVPSAGADNRALPTGEPDMTSNAGVDAPGTGVDAPASLPSGVTDAAVPGASSDTRSLPSGVADVASKAGVDLPGTVAPALLASGVSDAASKAGVDLPGAGSSTAPTSLPSGVVDVASKLGVDLPGSGTEGPESLPSGVADVDSKLGVDVLGAETEAPASLPTSVTDFASKVGVDLPGTAADAPVSLPSGVTDMASTVGIDLPSTEGAAAPSLPTGVTDIASKAGIDLPGTGVDVPVTLPSAATDAAATLPAPEAELTAPSGTRDISLPSGVADAAPSAALNLPSAPDPTLSAAFGVSDMTGASGLTSADAAAPGVTTTLPSDVTATDIVPPALTGSTALIEPIAAAGVSVPLATEDASFTEDSSAPQFDTSAPAFTSELSPPTLPTAAADVTDTAALVSSDGPGSDLPSGVANLATTAGIDLPTPADAIPTADAPELPTSLTDAATTAPAFEAIGDASLPSGVADSASSAAYKLSEGDDVSTDVPAFSVSGGDVDVASSAAFKQDAPSPNTLDGVGLPSSVAVPTGVAAAAATAGVALPAALSSSADDTGADSATRGVEFPAPAAGVTADLPTVPEDAVATDATAAAPNVDNAFEMPTIATGLDVPPEGFTGASDELSKAADISLDAAGLPSVKVPEGSAPPAIIGAATGTSSMPTASAAATTAAPPSDDISLASPAAADRSLPAKEDAFGSIVSADMPTSKAPSSEPGSISASAAAIAPGSTAAAATGDQPAPTAFDIPGMGAPSGAPGDLPQAATVWGTFATPPPSAASNSAAELAMAPTMYPDPEFSAQFMTANVEHSDSSRSQGPTPDIIHDSVTGMFDYNSQISNAAATAATAGESADNWAAFVSGNSAASELKMYPSEGLPDPPPTPADALADSATPVPSATPSVVAEVPSTISAVSGTTVPSSIAEVPIAEVATTDVAGETVAPVEATSDTRGLPTDAPSAELPVSSPGEVPAAPEAESAADTAAAAAATGGVAAAAAEPSKKSSRSWFKRSTTTKGESKLEKGPTKGLSSLFRSMKSSSRPAGASAPLPATTEAPSTVPETIAEEGASMPLPTAPTTTTPAAAGVSAPLPDLTSDAPSAALPAVPETTEASKFTKAADTAALTEASEPSKLPTAAAVAGGSALAAGAAAATGFALAADSDTKDTMDPVMPAVADPSLEQPAVQPTLDLPTSAAAVPETISTTAPADADTSITAVDVDAPVSATAGALDEVVEIPAATEVPAATEMPAADILDAGKEVVAATVDASGAVSAPGVTIDDVEANVSDLPMSSDVETLPAPAADPTSVFSGTDAAPIGAAADPDFVTQLSASSASRGAVPPTPYPSGIDDTTSGMTPASDLTFDESAVSSLNVPSLHASEAFSSAPGGTISGLESTSAMPLPTVQEAAPFATTDAALPTAPAFSPADMPPATPIADDDAAPAVPTQEVLIEPAELTAPAYAVQDSASSASLAPPAGSDVVFAPASDFSPTEVPAVAADISAVDAPVVDAPITDEPSVTLPSGAAVAGAAAVGATALGAVGLAGMSGKDDGDADVPTQPLSAGDFTADYGATAPAMNAPSEDGALELPAAAVDVPSAAADVDATMPGMRGLAAPEPDVSAAMETSAITGEVDSSTFPKASETPGTLAFTDISMGGPHIIAPGSAADFTTPLSTQDFTMPPAAILHPATLPTATLPGVTEPYKLEAETTSDTRDFAPPTAATAAPTTLDVPATNAPTEALAAPAVDAPTAGDLTAPGITADYAAGAAAPLDAYDAPSTAFSDTVWSNPTVDAFGNPITAAPAAQWTTPTVDAFGEPLDVNTPEPATVPPAPAPEPEGEDAPSFSLPATAAVAGGSAAAGGATTAAVMGLSGTSEAPAVPAVTAEAPIADAPELPYAAAPVTAAEPLSAKLEAPVIDMPTTEAPAMSTTALDTSVPPSKLPGAPKAGAVAAFTTPEVTQDTAVPEFAAAPAYATGADVPGADLQPLDMDAVVTDFGTANPSAPGFEATPATVAPTMDASPRAPGLAAPVVDTSLPPATDVPEPAAYTTTELPPSDMQDPALQADSGMSAPTKAAVVGGLVGAGALTAAGASYAAAGDEPAAPEGAFSAAEAPEVGGVVVPAAAVEAPTGEVRSVESFFPAPSAEMADEARASFDGPDDELLKVPSVVAAQSHTAALPTATAPALDADVPAADATVASTTTPAAASAIPTTSAAAPVDDLSLSVPSVIASALPKPPKTSPTTSATKATLPDTTAATGIPSVESAALPAATADPTPTPASTTEIFPEPTVDVFGNPLQGDAAPDGGPVYIAVPASDLSKLSPEAAAAAIPATLAVPFSEVSGPSALSDAPEVAPAVDTLVAPEVETSVPTEPSPDVAPKSALEPAPVGATMSKTDELSGLAPAAAIMGLGAIGGGAAALSATPSDAAAPAMTQSVGAGSETSGPMELSGVTSIINESVTSAMTPSDMPTGAAAAAPAAAAPPRDLNKMQSFYVDVTEDDEFDDAEEYVNADSRAFSAEVASLTSSVPAPSMSGAAGELPEVSTAPAAATAAAPAAALADSARTSATGYEVKAPSASAPGLVAADAAVDVDDSARGETFKPVTGTVEEVAGEPAPQVAPAELDAPETKAPEPSKPSTGVIASATAGVAAAAAATGATVAKLTGFGQKDQDKVESPTATAATTAVTTAATTPAVDAPSADAKAAPAPATSIPKPATDAPAVASPTSAKVSASKSGKSGSISGFFKSLFSSPSKPAKAGSPPANTAPLPTLDAPAAPTAPTSSSSSASASATAPLPTVPTPPTGISYERPSTERTTAAEDSAARKAAVPAAAAAAAAAAAGAADSALPKPSGGTSQVPAKVESSAAAALPPSSLPPPPTAASAVAMPIPGGTPLAALQAAVKDSDGATECVAMATDLLDLSTLPNMTHRQLACYIASQSAKVAAVISRIVPSEFLHAAELEMPSVLKGRDVNCLAAFYNTELNDTNAPTRNPTATKHAPPQDGLQAAAQLFEQSILSAIRRDAPTCVSALIGTQRVLANEAVFYSAVAAFSELKPHYNPPPPQTTPGRATANVEDHLVGVGMCMTPDGVKLPEPPITPLPASIKSLLNNGSSDVRKMMAGVPSPDALAFRGGKLLPLDADAGLSTLFAARLRQLLEPSAADTGLVAASRAASLPPVSAASLAAALQPQHELWASGADASALFAESASDLTWPSTVIAAAVATLAETNALACGPDSADVAKRLAAQPKDAYSVTLSNVLRPATPTPPLNPAAKVTMPATVTSRPGASVTVTAASQPATAAPSTGVTVSAAAKPVTQGVSTSTGGVVAGPSTATGTTSTTTTKPAEKKEQVKMGCLSCLTCK